MESKRLVASNSAVLSAKLQFLRSRLRDLQANENGYDNLDLTIRQEVSAIERDVTALLDQLRPHRIAIAGIVAAGKSSFVNKALVNAKLLGTGKGRTTVLPLELAYRDSDKYHVTVEFVDEPSLRALLRFLGQWELRKQRDESPDEDETKQINAARVRLTKLFSNVDEVLAQIRTLDGDTEVSSLVLREMEETRLINGPAHVEEVTSIEGAKTVIARYSKDPLMYVVRSIRVEGPFEFIPPGVVVVDTPGLGDSDVVVSQRTDAQLSLADEVWHLSPSAQSFSVELEQTALVRSLSEAGDARMVRVIVTKCRGELDEDNDDANETKQVATIRDTLVKAHLRGRNAESMTADERAEWEKKRPAIEQRVDAIPLAFTEFHGSATGVDTVRGWLQALSVARTENLNALERAFETIMGRLEGLFALTVNVPAPCTEAELQPWCARVDYTLNHLDNAAAALPYSMWSDGSFDRMVALNRWFIDPAAQTRCNHVHGNTVRAIMRKYGYHCTEHGTQYNLTLDIWNRYLDYTLPVRGCINALRNEVLALDANDARYAAMRATLQAEFTNIENALYGFGGHQAHVSALRPLYERYSSQNITWKYDDHKVYFFQSHDIDFAPLYRPWIHQHIANVKSSLRDTYRRLVTPIVLPVQVPAAFRVLLDQVRGIDATPLSVASEDNICPISLGPFTDPVSLPCRHVFDRSSLEGLIRYDPRSRCPLCRAAIGAPDTWLPRPDVMLRSILLPAVVPTNSNWCENMTATVVAELRSELRRNTQADVAQLTASVDAMVLGSAAAPLAVLGPAQDTPGPVPGSAPVPAPWPLPGPAPGPGTTPAPATADGAIVPPSTPRK